MRYILSSDNISQHIVCDSHNNNEVVGRFETSIDAENYCDQKNIEFAMQ
jgi:hypothetical protein